MPGFLNTEGGARLEVLVDDPRIRSEAERVLRAGAVPGGRTPRPEAAWSVHITCGPGFGAPEPGASAEGYSLHVGPDGVDVTGETPAGCFYGLQTLRQLLALHPGGIPCMAIVDAPAMAMRGLLYDVTRGKVPRAATVMSLIDRLAALKCNHLQLYIEHAFAFAFDPDICDEEHGLTPDEIRAVDAHAKSRFITLAPALASLGHMGRILSLPRYRHLAEVEPALPWERMSWHQRARGFTLDVLSAESMRLVERLWGEILEAFSSPVVNICGDEPHDLGRGKNARRLDASGRTDAYVRRIADTSRFVQSRGRRAQMWSDVLLNCLQADLGPAGCAEGEQAASGAPPSTPSSSRGSCLERLPRDLTILHWGYDEGSRYDMTRRFIEAGFDTVVCPGTTGWKRVLNAINLAERNITSFTRAGLKAGATGLLNTDWGDHGHFNAPGCSAHGVALGASCAWSGADEQGGAGFDRRFSRWILGGDDPGVAEALRGASRVADACETWTLLRTPSHDLPHTFHFPAVDAWRSAGEAARLLARELERLRHQRTESAGVCAVLPGLEDAEDLRLAAAFTELLCDRMLAEARAAPARGALDWEGRLRDLASRYVERASCSFKRPGVDDIADALAPGARIAAGVLGA